MVIQDNVDLVVLYDMDAYNRLQVISLISDVLSGILI